jgi:hypothetical protein
MAGNILEGGLMKRKNLFVGLFLAACATLLLSVSAWAVQFQKGDVFAGVGTGRIKHFSPTGTLIETLDTTTGSSEDLGMCFDSVGNLYTTDSFGSANTMSKFSNTGALLLANFGSGFDQNPESCIVDNTQNVYVGQPDGLRKVLKFNTSGTPLASFAPTTQNRGTDWIDLASDQCTLFYTSEGTSIKRFNVCTNTQLTDFASGLPTSCFALRIRPNGEVMAACDTQVIRLNSSGSVTQTYPISGEFIFALNLDPDGTHFWTGGYFTGNVFKVDIATGSGTNAPLFNAGILGTAMSGITVFGEITASQPPTQSQPTSVPTMTEWGMIVFMLLAGLGSVLFLRRQRRAQL